MNIPKSVKIGFKDYKINMKENVIDGGDVCYGNISYDQEVINIANSYSDDQQKATLIHEAIHGVDFYLDIGLTEEQITKLGKGLYTFIKDNPDIFKECSINETNKR